MIINKFLNLLYPDDFTCVLCGNEVFDGDPKSLCKDCKNTSLFISGKVCKRCGMPIYSMADYCERCKRNKMYITKNRSVFCYRDEAIKLVTDFKFKNCKYLQKPLAKMLEELYKKENYKCDIITFVPMHPKRQKQRGYNQCELLATKLSKLLNIPLSSDLIKQKETSRQVDLNLKQRQQNLKDAFKVTNKSAFLDKDVLIIDDVFTTGSTINNCAIALLGAGAKRVYSLTVSLTELK